MSTADNLDVGQGVQGIIRGDMHVMSGSRWQAGRIDWSVSVTGRAADRLETWGHEPLDEQACGERIHRLVHHVDDLLPPRPGVGRCARPLLERDKVLL